MKVTQSLINVSGVVPVMSSHCDGVVPPKTTNSETLQPTKHLIIICFDRQGPQSQTSQHETNFKKEFKKQLRDIYTYNLICSFIHSFRLFL